MHHAKIANSPRLQRVLRLLMDVGAKGATTLEIIHQANVCAVNSAVSELRRNGYGVECNPVEGLKGVYRYMLMNGNHV
jgi:hypothetical protein